MRWRMLCEAAAIEQRSICSIRKASSVRRTHIAHAANNSREAAPNGVIGHQHSTEATRQAWKHQALDAFPFFQQYRFTYLSKDGR